MRPNCNALALIALLTAMAAGCAGAGPPPKAPAEAAVRQQQPVAELKEEPDLIERKVSSFEVSQEVYQLRFGDELQISLWGHTDLNQSAPVREDGTFSFPLIGNVQAQGRTLRKVEEDLRQRLDREFIVNPQVTVRLMGAKFSIFGEVSEPGSYPIEGSTDLLTAISQAGGITKFGSSRVEVIRLQGNEKLTVRANVERILRGKEPNVSILPHDTIYVRRRIF